MFLWTSGIIFFGVSKEKLVPQEGLVCTFGLTGWLRRVKQTKTQGNV